MYCFFFLSIRFGQNEGKNLGESFYTLCVKKGTRKKRKERKNKTKKINKEGGTKRTNPSVSPNQTSIINALIPPRQGLPLIPNIRIPIPHTEPSLKSRHLLLRPRPVAEVVDGDAAAAGRLVEQGANLPDPLVGPVAGAEVHDGRPVVGEVVDEGARRAVGHLGRVAQPRVHVRAEAAAAHDGVQVRGGGLPRVDESVFLLLLLDETSHAKPPILFFFFSFLFFVWIR